MQKNSSNKSLNIVLCLAGNGQRFLDKGYKIPKFLLEDRSNNTSILDLIIENLAMSGIQNFFLVLNTKHQKWEYEIKKSCLKFKNLNINYFFIEGTSGQAETAYKAIQLIIEKKLIDQFNPIGFHNGDTILFNRNFHSIIKKLDQDFDGAIDTFPANSDAYSYIKTTEDGVVKEIKEKSVISLMASTGLYIFKNYKIFMHSYNKTIFLSNEKYISAIYQTMIEHELKVINLHNISQDDTLILGTPSEYERWIKNG